MNAPKNLRTLLMSAVAIVLTNATLASAQTIGVKDIHADGDTTIRVEKGRAADQQYEIITNSDEIEGDTAPLLKDARDNWNTACKEWKKETKELHKDNQIVALNCGAKTCTTTAMETSCHSTGTSKVKVRVK